MNRRHSHILGIGALAMAFVIGGSAAYAQGGPRGGPGFGARALRPGLMLRGLDLTEAQREQVRQVGQQHQEEMRALMERLRTAREASRQAVQAVPVDEPRVRAAMQDVAAVEADLAVARARIQSEVQALLTADQQQELQKRRAEREARMKERAERFRQRVQRRPQA